MPDRKPPRSIGDDRAVLCALLQYQRESFAQKVDGVDERRAREPMVTSGTSILWLTKHLALAEQVWILQRFAGIQPDLVDDAVRPDDSVHSALADYRRTWALVDAVVDGAPDLDAICHDTGNESPVNLRWVLAHLLEETARHAGHVDILREMIDGSTGR